MAKFIDETTLLVQSGKGGPGCISFRREKFVPRGGPDGGDGGHGGHVIFRVNHRLNTLIHLHNRRKLAANNGQPGGTQDKTGADGEDLVIEIPPGTIIHSDAGVLDDFDSGDFIFLKGGRGGKGNAFFTNSVNQAPEKAQPGEAGQTQELRLELKLIADVGLVGFPNAGKSTLISRISAAKPKIADYPFTTLTPHLGVVSFGEADSFVVADIPGLIPGAHQGQGLGIQFLRHIERTRIFIHLIDTSGFSGRDPFEDYQQINHELAMYDQQCLNEEHYLPLINRPQLVVFNKVDSADEVALNQLEKKFRKLGIKTRKISAVTGAGVRDLVNELGEVVFGKH